MEGQEGTIQTDVSKEQERPRSQREVALSLIEDRLDQEYETQQGTGRQEADTTQQSGQPVVVDDPQQFLVRVKVDGKEETKPLSEVVSSFQKNEVASERLRQASLTRKELEAWEKDLKEREQQIQLASVSASEADPDDGLDQALGALVEGDTATAAAVIREMVNKGRQQTTSTVDPKAIAAQVATQVKEELSTGNDWETFVRDHPEFREDYDDQGALKLTPQRQYGDFVYERDFAARVEKGEISYLEALNATAGEVRKVFSPPSAAQPEQTTAEKKLERKKAIETLPVAAGARATGPAAEQEESPSDVILNMRKARRLPT